MRRINNVLVVGVGGQGIILATDVIADTFLRAGFDSKKSEVHGMAQRGGSVESHVRRGDSVASPLISPGDVDAMVAMEGLEALRYAHMMHPEGQILCDPLRLPPLAVATGSAEYPEDVKGNLARYAAGIHLLPAYDMAEALGNIRVQNAVLLGALATMMELPRELWLESLQARVPAQAVEANRCAFLAGMEAIDSTFAEE